MEPIVLIGHGTWHQRSQIALFAKLDVPCLSFTDPEALKCHLLDHEVKGHLPVRPRRVIIYAHPDLLDVQQMLHYLYQWTSWCEIVLVPISRDRTNLSRLMVDVDSLFGQFTLGTSHRNALPAFYTA